jgi:hypothetical protein
MVSLRLHSSQARLWICRQIGFASSAPNACGVHPSFAQYLGGARSSPDRTSAPAIGPASTGRRRYRARQGLFLIIIHGACRASVKLSILCTINYPNVRDSETTSELRD